MATAEAPRPVRHQASQVRSAASEVRREASTSSGSPAPALGIADIGAKVARASEPPGAGQCELGPDVPCNSFVPERRTRFDAVIRPPSGHAGYRKGTK